jgi:hypothetical protein
MSRITVFKDSYVTDEAHFTTVDKALERIRNGASKDKIEAIREAKKKGEDYSNLKKSLPSFMFSGVFNKEIKKVYKSGKRKGQEYISMRDDDSCTAHSGFFVLDFDGLKVIESKMNQLRKDKYIHSAWESPSSIDGAYGVKALVRCPAEIGNHSKYYDSFIDRYPELDSTSRNLSRLCFESYDPNIYINPHSVVWRTVKPEPKKNEVTPVKTTDYSKVDIAKGMIESSFDGSKHDAILRAGNLIGGYIGVNRVDEHEALRILDTVIDGKHGIKDYESAKKTLRDGIEHGKTLPITEVKKIEKKTEYIKVDGDYRFLADKKEMDEYLQSYLDGTLEMGLSTGVDALDQWWMVKKNMFCIFGGLDNIGKSTITWYMAILQVLLNDLKVVVFAAENRDASVKKKLIEFMMGKGYREMNELERKVADEKFDKHFRIISSARDIYTAEKIIEIAEVLYETDFRYDIMIIDPYNALMKDGVQSEHLQNYIALSRFRLFAQNYSAVWLTAHAVTAAARTLDGEGYVVRPYKAALEGGQVMSNRADDMCMMHRKTNHPDRWMIMEFHVDKIKETDTGGRPTLKDQPIDFKMNTNGCGYTINGVDPIQEYWLNSNEQLSFAEPMLDSKPTAIQPNTEFTKIDSEDSKAFPDDGDCPF